MRALAAAVGCSAAALFGVGLISPLTPSEGCPTPSSLAVFAAVPALVAVAALRLVQHRLARVGLIVEAGAIATVTVWILHTIHCLQ